MPRNPTSTQAETAATRVTLTDSVEQTVHRLLVRWALRVLRSQESAEGSAKLPVQDTQSD